ncbi:MAG: ATP-binding domain-containing protein [Clostridiales bacterium]|nr:ATP-binding domain-containing protein [Clostridiales bacterium]
MSKVENDNVEYEFSDSYRYENAKLTESLKRIDEIEKVVLRRQEKLKTEKIHAADQLSEAILFQHFKTTYAEYLNHIAYAKEKPYFARVDYSIDHLYTIYIGRFGISLSNEDDLLVIDWRAPVADLYYSSVIGDTAYQGPKGMIKCNVSLIRQIEIENKKIKSLYDSNIVGANSHLEKILHHSSSGQMKDIVETIQQEQNAVIRAPLRNNIIVQGVPGSGKTAVALHRIAYLLYQYRDTLKPDEIIFFGPNQVFLGYISQVLPNLGVDHIKQISYLNHADEICKKIGFHILNDVNEIADRLTANLNEQDLILQIQDFMKNHCFFRDLVFNEEVVIESQSIERLYFKHIFVDGLEVTRKIIDDFIRRSIQGYLHPYKINCSNDEFLTIKKEITKCKKGIVSKDLFNPKFLIEMIFHFVYHYQIVSDAIPLSLFPSFLEVCYLLKLVVGNTSIKHIIIDEAQDYSPAQLDSIRLIYPKSSYTILGDIMQSTEQSYYDWSAHLECLGMTTNTETELIQFTVSYRSTKEILKCAELISQSWSDQSYLSVRHGEMPRIHLNQNAEYDIRWIEEMIDVYNQCSCNSIAIICCDMGVIEEIACQLSRSCTVLTKQYDGPLQGVFILDVVTAKGLEFDAVILPNAGACYHMDEYTNDKLLYIAITRAMHYLAMGYRIDHSDLVEKLIKFIKK